MLSHITTVLPQKACVDFILRNTQSVNVAELDKAMLAELLVAACSITPHRPAFPTPVPRTTDPFSAWGGRSTTTLAAAPTPPSTLLPLQSSPVSALPPLASPCLDRATSSTAFG